MSYFVFVLGYDLLHDVLNEMPCDTAYDLCISVYDDFIHSEYNNPNKSEYECLQKYVKAHLEEIKNEVRK